MHMLILAPLLAVSLGAMAPPQAGPAPHQDCPTPTITAAQPDKGKPLVRKLADEPPAALIATVDARHDGCPVMLVLAPGESALGSGWTPVPGSRLRPVE